MALFTLLPGVVVGGALSMLVHRLLYGAGRLPRPGWLPRVIIIPAIVTGVLLGVLVVAG